MLNKIINELEEAKSYYKPMSYMSGLNKAISIIKQHESEFNHHPLSPEDIERAASKYAFENNTHRSNSKAFIAGANFAKQHHKLGK